MRRQDAGCYDGWGKEVSVIQREGSGGGNMSLRIRPSLGKETEGFLNCFLLIYI